MYEETKSSIDWKGIFLKVVIAFLVVLIAVKGYQTLKGNDDKKETTTTKTVAESKSSSTFTANIEKLKNAGEKYFSENKDKLPKTKDTTTMVTLNELIDKGVISSLSDENGKTCDGESSYVTAMLEGTKTKIKANLVCGSASSYSLVYMGENDSENTEKNTNTVTETKNTKTYTNNNSTKSTSSTKSTNNGTSTSKTTTTTTTCGDSCTPSVSVSTETTATQTVTLNGNSNKNTTTEDVKTYYTVKFDSNGGNKSYTSKKVLANDTVEYPGSTYKNGYTFKGWYLNGKEYDFATPVTKNITLVAKFTRNNSYYDDDYYYDDNDYYYDDDYYYYDDDYYYGYSSNTNTMTTQVYSLMWDNRGTNNVSVSHKLRVPATIANSYNVNQIRIKKITFASSLNSLSQVNAYKNKFNDTFFYTYNGGEGTVTSNGNLSTIHKNAVNFNYSNQYKYKNDAIANGFDVTWNASYVSSQCTKSFNVANSYTGAYDTNLCGYGIVYNVTWEVISR